MDDARTKKGFSSIKLKDRTSGKQLKTFDSAHRISMEKTMRKNLLQIGFNSISAQSAIYKPALSK